MNRHRVTHSGYTESKFGERRIEVVFKDVLDYIKTKFLLPIFLQNLLMFYFFKNEKRLFSKRAFVKEKLVKTSFARFFFKV